MKKNKTTIILVLFFFIGLAILIYPSFSNYYNERIQTSNIDNYEEQISVIKKDNYTKDFNEAIKYNKALMKLKDPFVNYNKIKGYDDILNVKNGMIGYLTIEKINVELPIYHGTSSNVLSNSVGHLKGSSFPTGTTGTHVVLSAHRGLPSAKLFTHLDRLEENDTFTITVYDKVFTYQVDKIVTVKPKNIEPLKISKNKEYVTLMTCTPYGINTHRLLVRAHRIDDSLKKAYITTKAFKISKSIVWVFISLPILFLWLVALILKPVNKNIDYKSIFVYPKEKIERK